MNGVTEELVNLLFLFWLTVVFGIVILVGFCIIAMSLKDGDRD